MQPSNVSERLEAIRYYLREAAQQAGRAAEQIRLIGISKTKPRQAVAAALAAGLCDFGENTLQDARTKIPHFVQTPAQWHFLGHLQTNNAKLIAQNFHWVHSIDNLAIAEQLNNSALSHGCIVNGLLQVNMSHDLVKFGIEPDRLFPLLEQLLGADLKGIRLRGLMTIGRASENGDELRRTFAGLRELAERCRQRFDLTQFDELSMGMSGDYLYAVLEGATMVRVGTAVFGARDYAAGSAGVGAGEDALEAARRFCG